VSLVVQAVQPQRRVVWFKSVVAIINQISLLTVVLTGAAVIRERSTGR
jgi:ABC-2 type transport system permease protein